MKTGLKVADAMSTKPVTTGPEETAKSCAKLMIAKKVGSLIIKKGEELVGIVTEKDIVRLVAGNKNLERIKVRDIMTKKVHITSPETDLYDAMVKMRNKKARRLPVVAGKKVIGMLTMNDILKIQPYLYDFIEEKYHTLMIKGPDEEYIEGSCDTCENYGQLYKVGDKLLCEECRDEIK